MKKSRINFVDQTGGKRGRAVFVCLCSYDFEGSQLDAVYDKKRFAMKHSFSGGDQHSRGRYVETALRRGSDHMQPVRASAKYRGRGTVDQQCSRDRW